MPPVGSRQAGSPGTRFDSITSRCYKGFMATICTPSTLTTTTLTTVSTMIPGWAWEVLGDDARTVAVEAATTAAAMGEDVPTFVEEALSQAWEIAISEAEGPAPEDVLPYCPVRDRAEVLP